MPGQNLLGLRRLSAVSSKLALPFGRYCCVHGFACRGTAILHLFNLPVKLLLLNTCEEGNFTCQIAVYILADPSFTLPGCLVRLHNPRFTPFLLVFGRHRRHRHRSCTGGVLANPLYSHSGVRSYTAAFPQRPHAPQRSRPLTGDQIRNSSGV